MRGILIRVFIGFFRVKGCGSFSSNIGFLSLFKLVFAGETVLGGVADFAAMSAGCCGLGDVLPFRFTLFLGGRFGFGSGSGLSCRSLGFSDATITGKMTETTTVVAATFKLTGHEGCITFGGWGSRSSFIAVFVELTDVCTDLCEC